MNQIPQHKMIAHLRVCKGNSSNLQFLKSTSSSASHENHSGSEYIKEIQTLSKIIPVRSVRTAQEKRYYPTSSLNQNNHMIGSTHAPTLTPMPPSSPRNKGLALSVDSFVIDELNSNFHHLDIQEHPIHTSSYQSDSRHSLPFNEHEQQDLQEQDVNALQPHLPCPLCQRKFNAQDRLDKHIVACKKSSKSRKVFDMSKARVQGTEMEQYVLSPNTKKKSNAQQQLSNKKPKKSNWREKHLQFIEAIRGAKGVKSSPMSKDGMQTFSGSMQSSSDLVPCPTCHRSFNEDSAKRHIPMCKSKAVLQKREPKRGDVSKDELLKKRLAFKPPKPNKT